MTDFKPEGWLIDREDNRAALRSMAALREAMEREQILEARALVCTAEHDLLLDLGFCRGRIPREEGALGIAEGRTKDIALISRVGKPVCFQVLSLGHDPLGRPQPLLSRRGAQERCRREGLSTLRPGDIVDARVTHMEPFGCFVDIGCGIPALIPIDSISVSRIFHPAERFRNGQDIRAVLRSVDEAGRYTLSHRELLGTWEENAAQFAVGETVAGIIRSVESYGVFVELSPNLAGLAEPKKGARPGQQASVYIKNLIPEKMKAKLILVDCFDAPQQPEPLSYYYQGRHMDRWVYSPACCPKRVESIFGPEAAQ